VKRLEPGLLRMIDDGLKTHASRPKEVEVEKEVKDMGAKKARGNAMAVAADKR
jgi:hypothetical protein